MSKMQRSNTERTNLNNTAGKWTQLENTVMKYLAFVTLLSYHDSFSRCFTHYVTFPNPLIVFNVSNETIVGGGTHFHTAHKLDRPPIGSPSITPGTTSISENTRPLEYQWHKQKLSESCNFTVGNSKMSLRDNCTWRRGVPNMSSVNTWTLSLTENDHSTSASQFLLFVSN